jgi:hypothetical protein
MKESVVPADPKGYNRILQHMVLRLATPESDESERNWGTLKNELVYHQHYATRAQAIREITEYIEIFYNRQRRQKRLGYLSPAAYGRQLYTGKKVRHENSSCPLLTAEVKPNLICVRRRPTFNSILIHLNNIW